MSRILLADDSPHAQRMGERILRDEGHEVITVSDGTAAMLRYKDSSPDLVIADISMPGISGYELCAWIKDNQPAPVFLTAGPMELLDEKEISRVAANGVLKKPFEATVLLSAIGSFVSKAKTAAPPRPSGPPRSVVVLDPEQIRAAVTVALDAAMPGMVDHISERVLAALSRTGPRTGKKSNA
jgi:CheY-like chemotaxis protein